MKKLILFLIIMAVIISAGILLSSCQQQSSTVKRMLINRNYSDIKMITDIDTMYHIGDTVYMNESYYIIKR